MDTELDMDSFNGVLKECEELAFKKNSDYGCDSLTAFGGAGVFIRMYDKMSRLKNLYDTGRLMKASDESVEDTLFDLINYAVFLLLIRKGSLERNKE